jgi:hypothetical protein
MLYRAYSLGRDGHFHGLPRVIEADSDDEALTVARQYVDGYDIEVWEGQRRVAKLVHEGS